ncbi:dTDP-4-dehydrorhamnose reductase [Octadecabacter temperatus]|uniref:dTDP-4-dehydrorhamnose reductase n=1 Tax=Octadecabacter temperatus TaxID=1458307 RepID=A0A0K0YA91_9RHOB|nr:dTDP-4-dehydrorhamnose reductase [Octadecabacter temperatus]AKS47848.1 dTDP-4-dehydrorhamnose reductase [Octadecabacter temperatus]SIO48330.1 dTDP-4-dehydrorhamnose reductase [Octadecabacter temperatus]
MILVFGKSGQVARELSVLDGVKCLGRDEADYNDPTACAEIVATTTASAIINAVAYTAVDNAETDEETARIVNGNTPAAMAQAAAARGIPFVHISTDYVFEGNGDKPWKTNDPVNPQNAYGRTKLLGENGVRDAGGPHAILRTSWVVSAHGNNFVKTMLRLGEARDALTIVADQFGGPTGAREIAAACHSIAHQLVKDTSKSGTYHFSGAPDVSWADFAIAIFAKSGLTCSVTGIPSSDYPSPAARPLNSRLDCETTLSTFAISRPDWSRTLTHILADLEHQ